jgi:signal peptidase
MIPRTTRRRIVIFVATALVAAAVALPFLLGTQTFPVSIVEGNSMYPTLQTGDLVVFRAVGTERISNGTIILFVQGQTGIPMLDSFLKPVLIHRVIASEIQWDGAIVYQTKGDNNLLGDQQAVRADQILGTPAVVVPKVGLAVLFLKAPQGLLTIAATVLFLYLNKYEASSEIERKKEKFLGVLAMMALNNELPESQFRKFELATRYVADIGPEQLTDARIMAMVDWLKKGALKKDWTVRTSPCPTCSSEAKVFKSQNNLMLLICPKCGK